MKKIITLFISLLILSCSSSDDSSEVNNRINNNGNSNATFSIDLTSNRTAVVDEIISVDITGNENIMTLEASLDDFQTTIFNQTNSSSFGASSTLYFNFDELGNKTISIKAINNSGEEIIKTITVTILRGDAVKITSIEVVSFSNIHNTWDPEFLNTDVNRLADVFLLLRKPKVNIIDSSSFPLRDWFRSETKENQGDLIWDVSSHNLYINPNFSLRYSMADVDDGGMSQDIMLGPPFEREVTFVEHITTQPTTITLSIPNIDLEVVFTVEWN
ncbi:hypothetical protein [Bizionia sp. M204]|uniref:hypothetical protein n=1 Tax=Bizionia sp. M204 TaxID=2675331 RepID=UPI002067214D|nr:hypothetical protein [Bizionia sp. M204]UPS92623.1 hypothetical protein GMA17_13230 [Bizionia sp. M204]